MSTLKLIGYWIRSLDDEDFPPPQELVTTWDPDVQKRVVDHLNAGVVLWQFRGLTWCRFYCDKSMGSRELTDGQWLWPEDLVHYVREHNVLLPDEFVETALGGPSKVIHPLGRPIVDKSYWIAWSARHRSHSLRSKIAAAREKAAIVSERLKKATVANIERLEGVSENVCQMHGCIKMALSRRTVCATCYVEDECDLFWEIRDSFHNLKPVLTDREERQLHNGA